MRRALVVLVAALAVAAAGCSDLPDSGPVVDAGIRSSVDEERASDINAVPPVPGMTARAVVLGFIDAMSASPTRIDVAQQYLTAQAADEWEPDAGTITYGDREGPREQQLEVSVGLVDAERLDRSGAYVGPLTDRDHTLRFELTVEDGEYRITNPPDALVVPRDWFDQRYRPVSLYFFDPTGRILVPEPVYVPRGGQLPANLVARLLQGPSPALAQVVRSYLPRGLDTALSVPVTFEGVAEVDLGGEPDAAAGAVGAAGERILAQIAWTLRQEPGVRAVRVTLGGEPVRGLDGESVYPVEAAAELGPNGADPAPDLYAVRNRVLSTGVGNELVPVPGPFGGEVPISDAAVNLDGTRAAGVGVDGTSLVLADLARTDPAGRPRARVVVSGATDLLRPSWDFADRVWVVDRNGGSAVVRVVVDGRDREVEVRGVSGEDVRDFMVSRDGTRVVAVVAGRTADQVRLGRVELDDRGTVARVRSTEVIDDQPDLPRRVDDIVWTSPTAIAQLVPLDEDQIFEVRTVGVDGSPGVSEGQPIPVTGAVTALAGTPVEGRPIFVVTPRNIIDLDDGSSFGFVGARASSVFYAG